MNEKVMQELMKIEEQIEKIRAEHPEAENTTLPTQYEISTRTKKNLEILEDAPFAIEDWAQE